MAAIPTPLSQALADRYRLERELGEGGMATVYLAEDLKHHRQVAIKVLKPELAAAIGAERFLREIQTLAALQHPHILGLIDSGEAGGSTYYVMPYVDGESLRDRLAREQQLPVEEAVRITRDVADALEYAHQRGVVHRDIKPGNILLHGAHALVMDFGIALAVSNTAGTRMTESGMSLGTPQYMSPEQAMGARELGPRTDVYALGAVLYEMLTGDPPFSASTAQAIVAKVMTEKPVAPSRVRERVPMPLEHAVLIALEKVPADRFPTAAAFSAAIRENETGPDSGGRAAWPELAAPAWQRRPFLAVCGAAAVLAGVAAWGWLRPAPRQPVLRYSMGMVPGQAIREGEGGLNVTFSPDGSKLVYVGSGSAGTQLWLRARDGLDAVPVAGTDNAINPYFSPDGRRIAFSDRTTNALKVVPVSGGPATTLSMPGSGAGGGGVWGSDGWIYHDSERGISRIRPEGGASELIVPYDSIAGEVGFGWPDLLPDGKVLLYRSRHDADVNAYSIVAFNLRTHARRVLTKGVMARYVAPGYLVYLRADGAVLAATLDPDELAITGQPVPILDGVMVKGSGSADLAISRTGTLAYVAGPAGAGVVNEVVLAGRDSSVAHLSPALTFAAPTIPSVSLSPDGSRLALVVLDSSFASIWVKQLPSGPLARLSGTEAQALRPQWTPDGRSVMYVAAPGGGRPQALWRRRADGSGSAEPVLRSSRDVVDGAYSRDGRWLVYTIAADSQNFDIFVQRTAGDTTAIPLLTGPAYEQSATLSPDAKWLAYTSDESGRSEVYVVPFPAAASARWQVSISGGIAPRWAHSGRALYFENPIGELMEVPLGQGVTFTPGEARPILPPAQQSIGVPNYDLTPDDRRFVRVRITPVNQAPGGGRIVMVEHWTDELRDRMQTRQ
ncbi:MAG TPA: protein kinase [Gemmatimonadales bacterium]|jgi:serine/threonine-protein kinase|nr:protein kinase [Gemmatimonadales bacterium]